MQVMKKTELKSFDIASYDIELEFNKEIAPIQKKIDKLNDTHETKSLKAHKDFLTREKKSKSSLNDIDDRTVTRVQRIEKAVENKLVKLRRKDQTIKQGFESFKVVQNEAYQKELDQINEQIEVLKEQEEKDKNQISEKYRKNVESYVEKLDTYNNNFENNKKIFHDQYEKYNAILDESLERIENLKQESDAKTSELLQQYITRKDEENAKSDASFVETERILNAEVLKTRKNSNAAKIEINAFIKMQKEVTEAKYKDLIAVIKSKITDFEIAYQNRIALIDKDLQLNISKVDAEIEALGEKPNKRLVKQINKKKELFEVRATAVKDYQEQMYSEESDLLHNQIEQYEKTLQNELLNIDKLAVFLVNDQEQLKDTGEHFKSLNLDLKSELVQSEKSNNEYLIKHEKLKTEYINNYTKEFNQIKKRLIEANKSQIDQLTTINSELDDINKFLDTVEPLKEIELNKLRESIEVNEVSERYNIKYAKQEHERKIFENENRLKIGLDDIRTKIELSDNNRDITEIKIKETHDKQVEKAKQKYSKAEEIYKLRLNSTKLERNILTSSYETELQKADLSKEYVRKDVVKRNKLLTKEIENSLDNINLETKYKKEVVQKRLEEDKLKLQESYEKLAYDKESFTTAISNMIGDEEKTIDKEIRAINHKMDEKLTLIEEALNREIKEPSLNIARSEVIIKERLAKFDYNNQTFTDFTNTQKELILDKTLTSDQIRQLIVKNKNIRDKAEKYINNTYEVLVEAISFMNELEERAFKNQIASTADQALTKKLNKQLTKKQTDAKKQLQTIESSKKDHITRIKSLVDGNIQRLQKQKNISIETLKEQIDNILDSLYKQLHQLQDNIKKEVEVLYTPLTKNDQDILDNAHQNAIKAKEGVERERELQIAPINKRLGDFIKEKQAEKDRISKEYDDKMYSLEEEMNLLEEAANTKIKEIDDSVVTLISDQKKKLVMVSESTDTQIESEIEEIIQAKLKLEKDYIEKLEKLDNKDEEAKKIFEYEERIYNIALETAQTRYNEAIIKTNKAHDVTLKDLEKDRQIIETRSERNIERINQELVFATNEFEKNIFTTRPKFEESIGDAQRAIDDERQIKEQRKEELLEQNKVRTNAIESTLYTSFKEAYEKLQSNLDIYLDKYAIIEEEYKQSNNQANERIASNFDTYKNAINDLGVKKIEKTRKTLVKINENMK